MLLRKQLFLLGSFTSIFCVTIHAMDSQINYLYAHGLADTHKQAYWYVKQTPDGIVNDRYLIDGRLFTFDFPDATEWFWRINFTKTSLAQSNELIALYQAYTKTMD